MTETPVTLDELMAARETLIEDIVGGMPGSHRQFLMSVKRGRPDWALLDVAGVDRLPAVRWRLENLSKLDDKRRRALVGRLGEVLGLPE
jgi:hypothetical protein